MTLLLDIGNTQTHLGWTRGSHVVRDAQVPTRDWYDGKAVAKLRRFVEQETPGAAALCSVVPKATRQAAIDIRGLWGLPTLKVSTRNLVGMGVDYPKPGTIGPDRLANAVAAVHRFGAPSVVLDFGTAVTLDVVNRNRDYVGGVIAPGLSAMTDYLHEKTALLPRIEIREIDRAIGRSTEEAMLIGAVHGYRGLIRELLAELRGALGCRRLPVVATGGYAELMADRLPEIRAVDPLLTLEGVRLIAEAHA